MHDLRYALRALLRSPGYTLVAVLALALGIGANAAVFSVVDGVLLQPLGYPEPERLYSLWSSNPKQGDGGYPPSYPDFRDWREQSRTLDIAFARGDGLLLRGPEGAEAVISAFVSEGFAAVLGTRPFLGRTFLPDEERPGGPRVAVLTYGFWQRRFGGDPAVIGRTLDFAQGAATVVGVLPPAVDYPGAWANLWMPLAQLHTARDALAKRDFRVDHRVIARLAPGSDLRAARTELDAISRRLAEAYPKEDAGWRAQLNPLRDDIVGDIGPTLYVLLGAVGFVLLIACANVANLQLVRASGRARELAVRTALGASRGRIVRQLLTESLLLAAIGGLAGLLLAAWGIDLLKAAAPANLPRIDELAIDGRVLAFTVVVSIATAALFGVVPALHAASASLTRMMQEGGRGAGRSVRSRRLRSALVTAQIALALVLLVGAGLLMRSFAVLRSVDPGITTDRLLTLRLEPPATRFDSPEKLLAVYERLRESLAAIPGIQSVGLINHFPLSGSGVITPVGVAGRPTASNDSAVALYRLADASYFATVQQRVTAGRALSPADMRPTSTAAVVNETFARQFLGGASPVGQRITVNKQAVGRPDYNQPIDAEVIGVVRDVKISDLTGDPFPEVYLPFPVNPWRGAFLTVRTTSDPGAVMPAVRRAVRDVDADLPVGSLTTVNEMLADTLDQRRFTMLLLAVFAATALTLAAIGIYGVLAFAVAQRTQEIGVRSALGATQGQVVRLFVREGVRLALAGLAVGLVLAWLTSRLLAKLVYGVSVTDLVTFVAVSLGLGMVALLASYLPARRAARVDPVVALRSE